VNFVNFLKRIDYCVDRYGLLDTRRFGMIRKTESQIARIIHDLYITLPLLAHERKKEKAHIDLIEYYKKQYDKEVQKSKV